MNYRYEYEETDVDVCGIGRLISALTPGDTDFIVWQCTIINEETDEVLSTGYAHSKAEAKDDAEDKL